MDNNNNNLENNIWVEDTRKRIKEIFDIFDKDKIGTISKEDAIIAMRELNIFATNRAIENEIIVELIEKVPSQIPNQGNVEIVPYHSFEASMLSLLTSKQWVPDPSDVLIQAFRTIDVEGKGWISEEKMREILENVDEKGDDTDSFNTTESEDMIAFAKDNDSGRIYYEDYIANLIRQVDR